MKSLIIGGGKVGYHLLHTLYDKGYDVALIEKNSDICSKIAEDIDAETISGTKIAIAAMLFLLVCVLFGIYFRMRKNGASVD